MSTILNLDLLWIGLAVAGAGTLGFSIYFSAPKSATSRAFLAFAIASIAWGIVNFASVRGATTPLTLVWLIRAVLFFATWFVFALLVLAYQFPETKFRIPKPWFIGLFIWTSLVSILVLTPLAFISVRTLEPAIETTTGPGIIIFALTVFAYVGAAFWILWNKLVHTKGEARWQLEFVLFGFTVSFLFLIVFDFIFPAFLDDSTLVPFGGLFLLPFIFGTAYAILRYRLFDRRVAIFGLLTFLLATATFFDVLLSASLAFVLYRVSELILVLVAGILLIRNMVREFELERELAETNARQETLIHFIGHEVKGFLTKAAGALAELLEGDIAALPEELRPFVTEALDETRHGATSVSDILKASNLKRGKVEFTHKSFDLGMLVRWAIEKIQPAAEAKGLTVTFTPGEGDLHMLGDAPEIADHVLRNLLDNAVAYTPSGSITISLERARSEQTKKDLLRLSIRDTGVGITAEDMPRLFTEGGHGKNSIKVNVHSTGYGLFIAKQIVEAHGGTIRAQSEGEGKGSIITVELPVET